ncbi:hypothetical protein GCM10025792_12220 [Pseudonocardia tropica]|uniref:hypothetical protein n=1 Tax=Pseudonocardia tropica TaxID=681289 RepID=UPI003371E7AD
MNALATVNVNGVRAAATKGLLEWLAATDARAVCLQEVRARPDELPAAVPSGARGASDGADPTTGLDGRYLEVDLPGGLTELDLRNRRGNRRRSGFLPHERLLTTPGLADAADEAVVDRAPAHDRRFSDHAPVVVRLGAV